MIVIVGATGHTGRPAADALLASGEKVRVIGRDAKKLEALTQKGAEAFVGNVEDVASMTKAAGRCLTAGFARASRTGFRLLRRRSR
jgi:uncharacterized protein YbjT (DUF2867 family)